MWEVLKIVWNDFNATARMAEVLETQDAISSATHTEVGSTQHRLERF